MCEGNKAGIFKNIIGAIIEPKEALKRVSEESKIFKYLIPITLVQLIITIVDMPKLISYTILKAQELPNFSQSVIPIMKNAVIISTLVAAIFSPVVIALIVTAVIKFITMFLQENGEFKHLLCVNILAYVPIVIGQMLVAVVMLFTDAENIRNISTSFTVFLSSSISETSTIYKLFSCFDLFSIWSLILVSIGVSVVYKMKIKKSSLMVLGIYIIVIVIRILV